MKDLNKVFSVTFLIILITISCLSVVCMFFIWSLNVLFPTLAIPYSLKTLVASWALIGILSVSVNVRG